MSRGIGEVAQPAKFEAIAEAALRFAEYAFGEIGGKGNPELLALISLNHQQDPEYEGSEME